MNVVLSPILFKEAYADLIEPEIQAWFDEAIFGPLFALLAENGIPVESKFQAIKYDEFERQNEIGADWTPFPAAMGSLGIPRAEMPQIRGEDRSALVAFLASRGIGGGITTLRPGHLRPTQESYSPAKVNQARARKNLRRPIIASADLRIVDGHHQWMAALQDDPSHPIPVVRLDSDVETMLKAIEDFPRVERSNASTSALEDALREGRVWYADGAFGGTFNASISHELRRLGATRDPHHRMFLLDASSLPFRLRGIVDNSAARSEGIHKAVSSTLSAMEANVAVAKIGLDLGNRVSRILDDLNAQFVRTMQEPVKGLDFITVSPEIQPAVRKRITENLTENLDLYIKDFAEEKIPELRHMVEANLQAGGRIDRLSKMIEAQYGVTKRKAKFLASQETSLLTAKFREERAVAAGSASYVWHTRRDNKVRHDHEELEGKTFLWSDPPIVDRARNRRAHPGEDWGCRCSARPIIALPKTERARTAA